MPSRLIVLAFVLGIVIVAAPVAAEMTILDVDPNVVARQENQTWVKIQNDTGNEEITLKVYRLGDQAPKFVDGLKQKVKKTESRLDIALPVKRSWFEKAVSGEYRFKVTLFDQETIERSSKEFVVQTDATSFAVYWKDPIAWLAEKDNWKSDDSIIAHVYIIRTSGQPTTVTIRDSSGMWTGQFEYDATTKLPSSNTTVEAKLSKSGKTLILKAYSD